MIAYHFPPLAGSSGIQRTLRFVQHLPTLGWMPIVLTAHPRAYEATSDDLLGEVPRDVLVERALAFDTARHFSLFKRYPMFLARPDRWLSWKWGAIPAGIRLIRRHQPAAIWSTYPIATAHVIAAELQRRSGLPWIADFRDPMAQEGYPAERKTWQQFKEIEETAVRHAACSVFVTRSAARMYRERYDARDPSRLVVIENGYDEESFAACEGTAAKSGPLHPGRITLLHSGIVYPSERDPTQLFGALGRLKQQDRSATSSFRVRFRAAIHDVLLKRLAEKHDVADFVEILPAIPYRDALQEMLRADGLLVMQASNCNEQIPAKVYEYLRAARPILALTDPGGDTADLVRRAGFSTIAPLDSQDEITIALGRFLEDLRAGTAQRSPHAFVASASRRSRSEQLASLLNEVVSRRS